MRDWLIKKLGGYTRDDACKIYESGRRMGSRDAEQSEAQNGGKVCTTKGNYYRKFELVKDAPADTKLPKRGSKYAAGYDFYAPHDFTVPAHGMSDLIHFNVKVLMPRDDYLNLKIRSGLSVKHGIMLACSGVIDADFANNPDNDGNIGARFINWSDADYTVKKGERCMQGIFLNYGTTVDDDADGVRGGGYGSTGKF